MPIFNYAYSCRTHQIIDRQNVETKVQRMIWHNKLIAGLSS
jgi:hypothetical protein